MQTINLPTSTLVPAQAITSDGAYHPLLIINNQEAFFHGTITITITVSGTGPLTGLKLTTMAANGGTEVNRLVDADFNTASSAVLPFTTGGAVSIYTAASGVVSQIKINMDGVAVATLYGKCSNATSLAFEVGG